MTESETSKLVWLCLMLLSGCYGHTDFVVVEPVRFVKPPATPVPNSKFGWVETSADKAERFRVRVGDLTYQRIIEPYMKNGELNFEEAISALSSFAESEVVKRQLCATASTPVEARKLIGSNTPPEMYFYVECNN